MSLSDDGLRDASQQLIQSVDDFISVRKVSVHLKIAGSVGPYRYEAETWPTIEANQRGDTAILNAAQQTLLEESWAILRGQVQTVENDLDALMIVRQQAARDGFAAPPVSMQNSPSHASSAPSLPQSTRSAIPTSDRTVARNWGALRWKPNAGECHYGDIFMVLANQYKTVGSNVEFYHSNGNATIPLASIRNGAPGWNDIFYAIFGVREWQPTPHPNALPLGDEFVITVRCSEPREANGRTTGVTSSGNPYQNPISAQTLVGTGLVESDFVPPAEASPVPLQNTSPLDNDELPF